MFAEALKDLKWFQELEVNLRIRKEESGGVDSFLLGVILTILSTALAETLGPVARSVSSRVNPAPYPAC